MRELARQSGFHEATVRQELRRLKALDLVAERRDGNRVYYRANRGHPLYREVHRMVLKTSGLVDVLARALHGQALNLALVFGSLAEDHFVTGVLSGPKPFVLGTQDDLEGLGK